MRKILTFILLVFSITYASSQACEIEIISNEDCCIKFKLLNDGSCAAYKADLGNGTILENNTGTFSHCYSESGEYEINVRCRNQFNGSVCGVNKSVVIENCNINSEPCVSYLCWEGFTNNFDCANAVLLLDPDGQEHLVNFVDINSADDSWCLYGTTFPIGHSVDVTGGYCEIGIQIIHAIESLGFEVEIGDTGDEDECFKGATGIPGYFITSHVKVIAVIGDDCFGEESGRALFYGCD